MPDDFLGYELEDWWPISPLIGPPLPKWMGITWPWYKPPLPPIIYTCPYCEAEFTTEAALLAHIATEHPGEPPEVWYTCPYCGAQFATEAELLAHIQAEHPVEPPPTEQAEFAYVSDIRITEIGGRQLKWEIDIQNTGLVAGECTVTFHRRVWVRISSTDKWSGWKTWEDGYWYYLQTATLQPGEVVTFSGRINRTSWQHQYKVTSEAGTLLQPVGGDYPKEFICRYCWEEGELVSFDTKAELDSHIASTHPEYLPMPLLTHFTLRGVSWPADFIMDGEHIGRIVRWDAKVCLSDEEGCPAGAGWSGALRGGPVDVSQPLDFTMPLGWLSAYPDIANSLKIRIGGITDLGWSTWICDSPRLERVPDESSITFEVTSRGCTNWKVS